MRLDAMTSTAAQPGFQVLAETPGVEVAVGAIGQVWRPNIPFVHVAGAAAFAAFAAPDFVKVAWAIRVAPRGPGAHVEVEVRVDATTERAWRLFRLYFVVVGPASRFIRRAMLRTLVRRFGRSVERPNRRALPGDDLVPGASMQMTHAIDVAASPGSAVAVARPDGMPAGRLLQPGSARQRGTPQRPRDSPRAAGPCRRIDPAGNAAPS
jgi:hypothetical protein